MNNKIVSSILVKKTAIISLLAVLILSLFVLYTPKVKSTEGRFSAVRAAEHIAVIAKEPHSYFDRNELEDVRVYIEDTMTSYVGASNVVRMTYTNQEMKDALGDKVDSDHTYGIENILATIPGTNSEGIMIVAHFDSRGHVGRAGELGESYGAMDDGYGISTMLELAYLLKDEQLENSIHFLFTDAEEVGLYGARMAALDSDVMNLTNFVINLESRGRYGPTYMFETSVNNKKVIDLYKNARLPITYSMATAVYSVMPNFTDFTPFIDQGLSGLNFATLAGLDNYHTPLDRYENINLSSIQHMGEQVEPVVREYSSLSKYSEANYFESNNDSVFFTLLPNVLITYSDTLAIIMSLVVLIGLVTLLVIKIIKGDLGLDILTRTLPKALAVTAASIGFGLLFSMAVAFIGKTDFNIVYTRVSGTGIPTFIFMGIIVLFLTILLHRSNKSNVLVLGVIINTVLAVVTSFVLSGASFLFLVTALFGLLSLYVEDIDNNTLKHVVYVLSYGLILLIILPLLYSFYMALTVGGVAILATLLLINGSVSIPIILNQFSIEA